MHISTTIKFGNMELSEIKYTILEKLHPYYGLGLYGVNKDSMNCGNRYKYQILKSWAFSSLSISEIKEMLPNISYRDVIELTLYYYPITESVGKFDNYSLCYNCFVNKYEDPLFMFNKEETIDINIIYSLCYAFDRLDVLINMKDRFREPWAFDYWGQIDVRKQVHQLMCDLIRKRRGEQIELSSHKQATNYIFDGNMFMCHLSYLLNKEQLLEFVFLMSTTNENLYNYLSNYLSGEIIESDNWSSKSLIREIVGLFDQDAIHKVILKYYPNSKLHSSRRTYRPSTIWKTEPEAPFTNFDYHLYPELINRLPKAEQMLYYLTSGKYSDYVRLRNEGISLVMEDRYALGINSFGSSTFNINFVSSMNTYMKSIEEGYPIDLEDSPLLCDYGLNESNSVEGFINFINFAKHDPND